MDKQAQWDIETLQKTIGVIPYEEMERDAIERAIKALEKQIHQKPDYERIDEYAYGVMTAVCPKCKGIVDGIFKDNYCRFCGQKIDWK